MQLTIVQLTNETIFGAWTQQAGNRSWKGLRNFRVSGPSNTNIWFFAWKWLTGWLAGLLRKLRMWVRCFGDRFHQSPNFVLKIEMKESKRPRDLSHWSVLCGSRSTTMREDVVLSLGRWNSLPIAYPISKELFFFVILAVVIIRSLLNINLNDKTINC